MQSFAQNIESIAPAVKESFERLEKRSQVPQFIFWLGRYYFKRKYTINVLRDDKHGDFSWYITLKLSPQETNHHTTYVQIFLHFEGENLIKEKRKIFYQKIRDVFYNSSLHTYLIRMIKNKISFEGTFSSNYAEKYVIVDGQQIYWDNKTRLSSLSNLVAKIVSKNLVAPDMPHKERCAFVNYMIRHSTCFGSFEQFITPYYNTKISPFVNAYGEANHLKHYEIWNIFKDFYDFPNRYCFLKYNHQNISFE